MVQKNNWAGVTRYTRGEKDGRDEVMTKMTVKKRIENGNVRERGGNKRGGNRTGLLKLHVLHRCVVYMKLNE